MDKYEEYKDSGVKWLGQIPKEWEVSKIKYVAEFQPQCDFTNLTEESIITYLPMEFIKNGCYTPNSELYGKVAHSLVPFIEGDIIQAKVTPCFENGNIAIMEHLESGAGLGSSELFVYRTTKIERKFL